MNQCKDCQYCVTEGSTKNGACHLNPPQVLMTQSRGGDSPYFLSKRPIVKLTDSCCSFFIKRIENERI